MSQRQQERGELVLPPKDVRTARDALTSYCNQRRDAIFQTAEMVFKSLSAGGNEQARKELLKALRPLYPSDQQEPAHGYAAQQQREAIRDIINRRIQSCVPTSQIDNYLRDKVESLLSTEKSTWPPKFHTPHRCDLPLLKKTTTWAWDEDELSIQIEPKTRQLTWNTDENNHTVDNVKQGDLWKTLNTALQKIKWTRGTGGVAYYKDEGILEGFPGSRISYRIGPLGQPEKSL